MILGVLTATGDTISQLLVDKVDDYNPWRTVKFAAAGMFIVVGFFIVNYSAKNMKIILKVPIQFRWLRFLEKVVTGKGLAASTKKMLLDQSLMGIIYN
jgi:hypothetical protein